MQKSGENQAQAKWDVYYRERALADVPWHCERIDPDLQRLLQKYSSPGQAVLDLGTGTGTLAIELARLRYRVTATDISPYVIDLARQRAAELAPHIHWLVDNIVESRLTGLFDLVLDRGCFHVLKEPLRPKYVQHVARFLRPQGILLLKTFSEAEPGDWGPYRFSIESLQTCFSARFELLEWANTVMPGQFDKPPKTLTAVFRRIGESRLVRTMN